MAVDVRTSIDIARPRHEVAAFAGDPDNAPRWYANIKDVTWRSSKPVAVGARVQFMAEFLGRRLVYTYDVEEWAPGERLVMVTSEGPFPMRTTYTWADGPGATTTMELRNEGEPSGLSSLAAPLIARAMERENRKDLRRLKALLEGSPPPDGG